MVYAIAVQQSVPQTKLPQTTALRLYTFALFLQALLVIAMYTSQLAGNFTDPAYIGDINTAEDFAKSNLEWGSVSNNFAMTLATDPKVCTNNNNNILGLYF